MVIHSDATPARDTGYTSATTMASIAVIWMHVAIDVFHASDQKIGLVTRSNHLDHFEALGNRLLILSWRIANETRTSGLMKLLLYDNNSLFSGSKTLLAQAGVPTGSTR
jgi:hypothetical protein